MCSTCPLAAGAAAFGQMEAAGVTVGPVAALGQDRMLFFVVTRGSPADEDEWWTSGLDCEPESVVAGPALALPGQLRARPAVL